MQKPKYILAFIVSSFLFAGIAYAAPGVVFQSNSILPTITDTFDLGSTTPNKEWNGLYVKNITVSGSCTGCGGGGSGVWPWPSPVINYGTTTLATTTPEWFKTGMMASSTSYFVNASTTALTVTNAIIQTNSLATSTFAGDITISNNNGGVPLLVGSTTAPDTGGNAGNYIEAAGNDNTGNGIQIGCKNFSLGINAYCGFYLNNALSLDGLIDHYGFLGYTGSNYSATTYGTGQAWPNLLLIQSTDAPTAFFNSSASPSETAFEWFQGGTASSSLTMILSGSGNLGISTTSPGTLLSVGNTTGVNIGTATSTWSTGSGINLTGGCFSIKGTCLTQSAGTVTSVTASTPNSTLTLGGTNPVTTSGTISFDINLGNANTWTGLQAFNNAATTTFAKGLYANTTASSVFYATSSGSVTNPSVVVGTAAGCAGIYLNGVGILGFTNCTSGISWNGTAFYPNTTAARTLGIVSTNLWQNLYVSYASTTETDATFFIGNGTFGAATTTFSTAVTVGTTTTLTLGNPYALTVSNAAQAIGGLVINLWTNVANAFRINKADGSIALNIDTTATVAGWGVASTSPWATLAAVGDGTNPIFAVATSSVGGMASSSQPIFMIDNNYHIVTGGPQPTFAACGTAPTITGNDNVMVINTGTAGLTECVVNFAKTWNLPPVCTPEEEGTTATVTLIASSSATQLRLGLSASLTGAVIGVQCMGLQ